MSKTKTPNKKIKRTGYAGVLLEKQNQIALINGNDPSPPLITTRYTWKIMIKDLTDSLKLTMYERATSPMTGVFILSWLAFNWKIPLVLFWDDAAMKERIDIVSSQYLIDPNTYLYYPLYSTITVLIFYPLLSLGPFYWWHWSSALKTKLKQKIDGGILLTKEQSIEIMNKVFRSKEDHRKEIEAHVQESEYLRNRISSFQEKETSLNSKMSKLNEKCADIESKFNDINSSEAIKEFGILKIISTLTKIVDVKKNV